MKVSSCDIPGPAIIEPGVFPDERGFFFESWNAQSFADAGLSSRFVQDNHSKSARGVLRGLHFQNPNPQGKLVRVVKGAAFDVAVDLRRTSPHFGKWVGAELSSANHRSFWVPEGFAHGFLALEDDTELLYKCTALRAEENEHILAWNDPDLAIDWPLADCEPMLSQKDRCGMPLAGIAAYG